MYLRHSAGSIVVSISKPCSLACFMLELEPEAALRDVEFTKVPF